MFFVVFLGLNLYLQSHHHYFPMILHAFILKTEQYERNTDKLNCNFNKSLKQCIITPQLCGGKNTN